MVLTAAINLLNQYKLRDKINEGSKINVITILEEEPNGIVPHSCSQQANVQAKR